MDYILSLKTWKGKPVQAEDVAKMVSPALNGYIMVQKGIFWTIGNTHILVSFTIIYSQGIKVIKGWNNIYENHQGNTIDSASWIGYQVVQDQWKYIL